MGYGLGFKKPNGIPNPDSGPGPSGLPERLVQVVACKPWVLFDGLPPPLRPATCRTPAAEAVGEGAAGAGGAGAAGAAAGQ